MPSMTRTKLFTQRTSMKEPALDLQINGWLDKEKPAIVVDIKYTFSDGLHSALVMYANPARNKNYADRLKRKE